MACSVDANITALKTTLQGYVDQLDAGLLQDRAQVALDQYIAAESAYSNIIASAATSYSDVRGTVNKRLADDAREEKDRLYQELVDLLDQGGVNIVSTSGITYWSLR
jgi:hypothetical protein